MVECPNCGWLNSDDNKFCGECGTKLPAPQNYCPNCDITYDGVKFCTQCGTKLVNKLEYLYELKRLKQEEIRKLEEKKRQDKLRKQEERKRKEEKRKREEKKRQEELRKQEERNILFNKLYSNFDEETIGIASRCLKLGSSDKNEVINALIDDFHTEKEINKAIRGQKRIEGYYSRESNLKWIRCPECQHVVNAAAYKCPYCNHQLKVVNKSPKNKSPKNKSPKNKSSMKEFPISWGNRTPSNSNWCNSCCTYIPKSSSYCPYCGSTNIKRN